MLLDFGDITVFNAPRGRKLLGAVADTDPRLSDARTPLPHTHRLADLLDMYSFGSSSGTMCQGNDARLSDSRAASSVDSTVLGSGAASSSTFLRGDRTWAAPTASAPGVVPVGAIVPWLKSFTGTPALPAEFKECNGGVVADAASPLNGQTLPNLNGNAQFLRGAATSGGTGGATTHTHTFSTTTSVEDGDTDVAGTDAGGTPTTVASAAHLHDVSGTTDPASVLPPYYEVVWVIRIK